MRSGLTLLLLLQEEKLKWPGNASGLPPPPYTLLAENKREGEKVDERGDDREDATSSASYHPWPSSAAVRYKKPSMPGKLSKEVPDMGPMQWPTGGGDGSEGGKKGAFLYVFLKGGFSTFETHHVSIHS